MSRKVELLSPAGNLDKLKLAFLYGADAVYIGGKNFSLRANAKNFSIEEIKEACDFAHNLNKKVYVTVNIVFHNDDLLDLVDYLKELEKCKVDAIIITDLFIIDLIKDNNINLNIHISTQNSSLNVETVEYLKSLGVERVVLARESSKENIKEIIDKTGMEIECFVHGAMCANISGRCVLSNYFTNRDANRGGCAQVCRWEFDLCDSNKNVITEDIKFAMAPKDLCMIDCLKDMIDIGICSLKVEGRMRSDYYIATVINTYKEAIDDYYSNNLDNNRIDYYSRILKRVSNRDNISQFFNRFPDSKEQYYLGRQEISNQDFLGIVIDYDKEKKEVTLMQRNYFKKGDKVEIFGPNIKTFSFVIPDIYDEDYNLLDVANHPTQIIKFKLDTEVFKDDIMRIKI